MSQVFLATGMEDSGMDSVIGLAMGSSSKGLEHIQFKTGDLSGDLAKTGLSPSVARDGFYSKVEKRVSQSLKAGRSVIVEGPLTMKTPNGYLPLIPKEFFESFAPEAVMLFEVPSLQGDGKEQQEVNRSYAAMFASLSGSLFKIIDIGRGGVKEAVKEARGVLSSLGGV